MACFLCKLSILVPIMLSLALAHLMVFWQIDSAEAGMFFPRKVRKLCKVVLYVMVTMAVPNFTNYLYLPFRVRVVEISRKQRDVAMKLCCNDTKFMFFRMSLVRLKRSIQSHPSMHSNANLLQVSVFHSSQAEFQ